jgi:frataxin-like iron-binding protein CyaY
MGAWWYLQNGFVFRDSIKFMDLRVGYGRTGLYTGRGHLLLWGFSHEGYYCYNTYCGPGDYVNQANYFTPPGTVNNLTAFKYCSAPQTATPSEGNFNNYIYSPMFDQNVDIDGIVVPRESWGNGLNGGVNRQDVQGGMWIAVIVHGKVHETDGVMEAWIKRSTNPLYKVMEYTKDTVWSSDNSHPHTFYTKNEQVGYDLGILTHQWFGYMNSGTTYPASQYLWLANPCVGETYSDVAAYLGLDGGSPSIARSIKGSLGGGYAHP